MLSGSNSTYDADHSDAALRIVHERANARDEYIAIGRRCDHGEEFLETVDD